MPHVLSLAEAHRNHALFEDRLAVPMAHCLLSPVEQNHLRIAVALRRFPVGKGGFQRQAGRARAPRDQARLIEWASACSSSSVSNGPSSVIRFSSLRNLAMTGFSSSLTWVSS